MKIDDIKPGRWYVTRLRPCEPWQRHSSRPSESAVRDGHGGQLVKVLGVGHYTQKYGECGKRIIEPRSATTGRRSDIEVWIEYTSERYSGEKVTVQGLVSPRMILLPKAEYEDRAAAWKAEWERVDKALRDHQAELARLKSEIEKQAGCKVHHIRARTAHDGEAEITLTLDQFRKIAPGINGEVDEYIALARKTRDEVTC